MLGGVRLGGWGAEGRMLVQTPRWRVGLWLHRGSLELADRCVSILLPTYFSSTCPIGYALLITLTSTYTCSNVILMESNHQHELAVGLSELSYDSMTGYDMGVSCKLSEFTVGLSDGSCQAVSGSPVGAVILSDLCRISVGNVCRAVGPGLKHRLA